MMKKYETKDLSAGRVDSTPTELVCIRECVTPGLGAGTWAPGDKVTDPELVKMLSSSPYFKQSMEVN